MKKNSSSVKLHLHHWLAMFPSRPHSQCTQVEREREYSWCAGYRCPLSYLAMHMQGHCGIDGREPVALQEELEHAFGEDVTSVAY